jgi:acyl-CoA dehydrogenase
MNGTRRKSSRGQEAAKIGLYGFEGVAQFFADESGLSLPIVNEELFWGDAGIGMAIMGTGLASAIFGQDTPSRGRVDLSATAPRTTSSRGRVQPDAGSDVSAVRTVASTTRPRTNG